MSDRADNVVMLTQQGRPTDEATKEDAFRLWVAFGRSCKLVSEKTGIPERTLHRWREGDDWEDKRRDQAAAFLPGMTTEGAIAARIAGHNAMLRMQQISFDALEYGIKPDPNEVKSLALIADRGGYSPVGNKSAPPVDIAKPVDDVIESLSGLPPDELMRLEEAAKGRKG